MKLSDLFEAEDPDYLADSYGIHDEHGQDYYLYIRMSRELKKREFEKAENIIDDNGCKLKGSDGVTLEIKDLDGLEPSTIRSLLKDFRSKFPDIKFRIFGQGVLPAVAYKDHAVFFDDKKHIKYSDKDALLKCILKLYRSGEAELVSKIIRFGRGQVSNIQSLIP